MHDRVPAIRARTRGLATLAVLVLAGCGDSPSRPDGNGDPTGVDLLALFAPPTAAEREAVAADWATREVVAEAVVEEAERVVQVGGGSVRLRVISHVVDGHRHHGAVLEPLAPPPGTVPILVYAHGGDGGVSLDEVLLVAEALGLAPDDYVIVVPSFRSESLRIGGDTWVSQGPASPWDRDVDDALALVEVAIAAVPFADPGRIVALGLSRGGAVALLMGIRDPRIRGVVSYFAPTDFFGPFVQDVVREVLAGSTPALPGVDALARDFIEPLREGVITTQDVRLELLRRSSARFAQRLPAVQIHHGTADDVVPVEEAQHLVSAMQALGRGPPEFQAYIYPGAGHSPLAMPQSVPRVRSFLEALR